MKTALITGASRGIGAATAKIFSANGYRVIALYNRSKSQAESLACELNSAGGDVHVMQVDLSDLEQIQSAFDYIAKYYKKIDVLVNNAGISKVGAIEQVSAVEVDEMWHVNALSAYVCCQKCFPLMKDVPHAAVVNVSSVWGVTGASCEVGYSMTKHAVVGLTASLAEEWAPSGVSVCCVCPPIVKTDMCAHLSKQDVAEFCERTGRRAYTAEQVAKDIFYLATQAPSGTILEEK